MAEWAITLNYAMLTMLTLIFAMLTFVMMQNFEMPVV